MKKVAAGIIIAAALAGCGRNDTSPSNDAETERQFQAAQDGARVLIAGVTRDWQQASEEAKNLYALSSVDALNVPENDRAMYARLFRRCMDDDAQQASPGKPLGDISYGCANGLRYALEADAARR